jgi:hypothetical protein
VNLIRPEEVGDAHRRIDAGGLRGRLVIRFDDDAA